MTEDLYVAGRIERALAEDPRTHELGVRADIEGDTVVLRGEGAGAAPPVAALPFLACRAAFTPARLVGLR